MKKNLKKLPSGAVLVEILIGIVIVVSIALILGQLNISSFRATQFSGDQAVMDGLAQEGIEAVEALTKSDWHNIYDLTKSSQQYYPRISGGIWVLTTDTAYRDIVISGKTYQRWVIIENVMRDGSDLIVTSGGTDDPSTQKATVTVRYTGLPDIVFPRFFSRGRNSTTLQTDWNGGTGQATNPTSGFDANFNWQYDGDDGNIDTTTSGEIKLLQ